MLFVNGKKKKHFIHYEEFISYIAFNREPWKGKKVFIIFLFTNHVSTIFKANNMALKCILEGQSANWNIHVSRRTIGNNNIQNSFQMFAVKINLVQNVKGGLLSMFYCCCSHLYFPRPMLLLLLLLFLVHVYLFLRFFPINSSNVTGTPSVHLLLVTNYK